MAMWKWTWQLLVFVFSWHGLSRWQFKHLSSVDLLPKSLHCVTSTPLSRSCTSWKQSITCSSSMSTLRKRFVCLISDVHIGLVIFRTKVVWCSVYIILGLPWWLVMGVLGGLDATHSISLDVMCWHWSSAVVTSFVESAFLVVNERKILSIIYIFVDIVSQHFSLKYSNE